MHIVSSIYIFSGKINIYFSDLKNDLKLVHVSQFWACIHYRYMILFSIHCIFVYIWSIVVWIVVSLVINIANQHYPDIPLRVNEDWQIEHLKGLELLWTCVWPWRLCILPNSLSEKKRDNISITVVCINDQENASLKMVGYMWIIPAYTM